jgi:uncharacterized protein (TIGR00255 family)
MLKSMTGFGIAKAESDHVKITVEIRCLNSRSLDLMLKPPGVFRELEQEIRRMAGTRLVRGKIDLRITPEYKKIAGTGKINQPLAEAYFAEMKALAAKLNQPETGLMESLFRIPDIFKNEEDTLPEEDAAACRQALKEALDKVDDFRHTEGSMLEKEISGRIQKIREGLTRVAGFEKERMPKIKARIMESLNSLKSQVNFDKNRFEEELIYYLEKMDITEEKVRLSGHLDYFDQMVASTSEDQGRKLNFLSQEIGREINTLGSKANDPDLQRLVVDMKDELEKIKEQLLNIL